MKIFPYYLDERIGIDSQFVLPYAVNGGEGLGGRGFDRGHVLQGLVPEDDEGRDGGQADG